MTLFTYALKIKPKKLLNCPTDKFDSILDYLQVRRHSKFDSFQKSNTWVICTAILSTRINGATYAVVDDIKPMEHPLCQSYFLKIHSNVLIDLLPQITTNK